MPWKITLLIAAAIAISYFDRQTLPVAIAAIQQDIPISNTQFSQLQAAFLVAYAIMYAGGGKLIDVMGTRRGFAAAMIWWSLACAAHGLANGFGFLAASRFLLGMGEGGGFPAATKAVGEWFSAKDRATAMGVINAGTAVGAVLAPPAIATIIAASGWRWVFVAAGAVGLVWAGCWLRVTGEASRNKSLESGNWLPLLGHKEIWSIVGAKFLSDAAWYFYLFWLPKYLYDVRGFDTKKVGYFAWIPYAAAGLGSLAGGWLSSWLLHKGFSVNAARKIALGCSAAVMPVILIVDRAPVEMAIAIFSIAFLGQQAWSTLVMILPTDLVRSGDVGSVAGMVGFGGAMGGVLFGLVVGYLLDNGFGYGPVFAMAGSFHVLAFLLILIVIPRIGRLDER
ncbi:MAG: MFS transporter [Bryobacterales bacterium]|nr:MFS transporter [Bryobacterales bacterium]